MRDRTPYAFDSEERPLRAARQVLRDAPIEQVEQILVSLPEERRRQVQEATLATSPALRAKPEGLGGQESTRKLERNLGYWAVMQEPLSRLASAVEKLEEVRDEHYEKATEEDRELVEQDMRNSIARLQAMSSDPEELLR